MSLPVEHSPIGASSMSRLIACPGSYNLSAQIPGSANRSSIYAATGTVAHALAEQVLDKGGDPADEIGTVVTVDGHDVTVDEDMVSAITIYVDELTRRRAGADAAAFEVRVCLDALWADDPWKPPVSAFGTCDAMLYHAKDRKLTIIDYKNGAGVFVDVVDNAQLLYYAAGALFEVPASPVYVEMVIVQPHVANQEKVRSFEITIVDLRMWIDNVLKPAIRAVFEPNSKLSAGKHCRFCPARMNCPALHAVAMDLAQRDFGPSPDQIITLSGDELGRVLRDMEVASKFWDALREDAIERIKQGEVISGWEVVPTRPTRKWMASLPDIKADLIRAGFPKAAAQIEAGVSLKTPAQAQKVLHVDAWAAIDKHVQSVSSGVKLAPTAPNALAAVTGRAPSAQDDFAF
jgi:hypothetical protein